MGSGTLMSPMAKGRLWAVGLERVREVMAAVGRKSMVPAG